MIPQRKIGLLFVLCLLTAPLFGAAWFVDQAAAGAGNGTTWADAFPGLQAALSAAQNGDEIWVAAGTYTPGILRTDTFQLPSGVAIYGGFAGSETDKSQRNIAAHGSILSGDIGAAGNAADNSYNVVTGGDNCVIDGFTLTGGNADGINGNDQGGAMLNRRVSIAIVNCTFTVNHAALKGGAIYNHFCSGITITDCTFTNNSAGDLGGAILNANSTVTITESVFTANSAASAGAIAVVVKSQTTIANCTFTANTAADLGGAVVVHDAGLSVSGTIFTSNAAQSGGAVYSKNADPVLSDSFFVGNTAQDGGAISLAVQSDAVIQGSSFKGNQASVRGGAVYAFNSDPVITGSNFYLNSAPIGAAISARKSDMAISSVTFYANAASTAGGALHVDKNTPVVLNSILWANTPDAIAGGTADVTYSDVQGGYPGTGNIDADPLFFDPINGDFRLLAGSPALGAGKDGANMGEVAAPGVTPPTAVISADTTTGNAPLAVAFYSTGSDDPDGTIAAFEWDFSYDGVTFTVDDTGPAVTHTYGAGTCTAALRVRDNDGLDSEIVTLVISAIQANQPPTASILADVNEGDVPLAVHFDGSGSADIDGIIALYEWDFDFDGVTFSADEAGAAQNTAAHTYTAAGTYAAALRVTDDGGDVSPVAVTVIEALVPNQAPTAVIGADATTGDAPLTVTFSAAGSADPDGTITLYEWDFEYDGVTFAADQSGVDLTTPVYEYTAVGTYTAALRVLDDEGFYSPVVTLDITVAEPNQAPLAVLTAEPTLGGAPLSVDFNAAGSVDADGTIALYEWNFEYDGVTFVVDDSGAALTTSQHEYPVPGDFIAALRVRDDDNAYSEIVTIAITVLVPNQAPIASITATPTNGIAPLSVGLDGNSSIDPDGTIVLYEWDFNYEVDDFTVEASGAGLTTTAHIYTQVGTYTAALRVTDNEGLTSIAAVGITVDNQAPTAVLALSPAEGYAPLAVTLNAAGSSDPDGTIAMYEYDFDYQGGTFTVDASGAALANTTHTYPLPGTYAAALRVRDDAGADSAVATVTVTVHNNAPTAALTVTPVTGDAPLAVTLDGSGSTDADGTITLYEWDFAYSGGVFTVDASGAVLSSTTHVYTFDSVYTVALRVTDDLGATAIATVSVNVTNTPPTALLAADVTQGIAPLAVTFDGSGSSDPNGTIDLWEYDFEYTAGAFNADISGAALTSAPHTYNVPGAYTAALRVTDNLGAENIATLAVTVDNQVPTAVIAADPSTGIAPLEVGFDAAGSADPDGTIALYEWDFEYTAGTFEADLSGAALSAPSHTYAAPGAYTAALRVTDDLGAVSVVATILIDIPNQTPVAVIAATPATGFLPLAVDLDGTDSTDVDGTIALYEWDFDYAAGTFTVDEAGQSLSVASHTYTLAGTYTAALRVTDDLGAVSVIATVEITANENQAPVANISATPDQGAAPLTVALDGTASSDPDGTIDLYEWDFEYAAGTFTVDASGAVLDTVSHDYTQAGTFTAALRVTDDRGVTDLAAVTITVSNQPPTAVISADPDNGPAPLTVTLNSTGSSDADGTITLYAWDFEYSGTFAADVSGAGLTSVSHEYGSAGTYTAALRITDNLGAESAVSTVAIEVTNQPPTAAVTALPNQGYSTLEVTLNGSGSADADGWITLYEWDFEYTAGTFMSDESGTVSSAVHIYNDAGTYTAALRVTDNGGATTVATVTVTVLNRPPTAVIAANPTQAYPLDGSQQTVTFNGGGSSDQDGTISTYQWDFDYHSPVFNIWDQGVSVQHLYSLGIYTAALRVIDNEGALSEVATITITADNLPSAVLQYGIVGLEEAPMTVFLDARSSTDPDIDFGGDAIMGYQWDLNYNGAAFVPDPNFYMDMGQHMFVQPGTYVVALRVVDSVGGVSPIVTHTFVVPNKPPVAIINIAPSYPTTAVPPFEVVFLGNNSDDQDPPGSIVTYRWDFGDGNTPVETTVDFVSHVFTEYGRFTATLVVVDNSGGESPVNQDCTVSIKGNRPPVADLSARPREGYAPLNPTLDASNSYDLKVDVDDAITLYEFDFEDDGIYDVSGTSPLTSGPVYGTVGTHTARLRVKDNDGATTTDTITIIVHNREPVADFTLTPQKGDLPLAVDFDGTISTDSDGYITSYEWDFEYDGTFGVDATGSTVSHPYTLEGSYLVALRVTDDGTPGLKDVTTRTVTVFVAGIPVAPSGLIGSGGDAKVFLNWADNGEQDLDGYLVYRKLTADPDYTQLTVDPVSVSSYTDTQVTNTMPYVYVVAAKDYSGNISPYSNSVTVTPDVPSSRPWHTALNRTHRNLLAVDHSLIDETLADFPVRVRLEAPRFNMSAAQDDGDDLLFTAKDGTLLDYEIESFDYAAGLAEIWVKLPSVSATEDTLFYAYYGNAAVVTPGQSPADVWTNGFAMVHHLEETDNPLSDSSSVGNNLYAEGIDIHLDYAWGRINGCDYLDTFPLPSGGPIRYYVNSPSNLDFTTALTLSAWIRMGDGNEGGPLMVKLDSSGEGDFGPYRMQCGPDSLALNISPDGLTTETFSVSSDIIGSDWHYVAATFESGVVTLFIDGAPVLSQNAAFTAITTSTGILEMAKLVEHDPFDGHQIDHFFSGYLDEVRMAGTARSAAWHKACWMAGLNALTVLSDTQTETDDPVAAAPVNVVASIGADGVYLEWLPPTDNGGSDILSYRIHRGTAPDSMSLLTQVSGYSSIYRDADVTEGQKYFYRIAAVTAVGEGLPSVLTMIQYPGVPSVPRHCEVALHPVSGIPLQITWEPPLDNGGLNLIGYNIYRLGPGDTALALLAGPQPEPFYADAAVTAEGFYTYSVTALNAKGESSMTAPAGITAYESGPPGPIRNLRYSRDGSVSLSWDPPLLVGGSALIQYVVYRDTVSMGETYSTPVGVGTTVYIDGAPLADPCYYHVRAENSDGLSDVLEEVEAVEGGDSIPPGPPTHLLADSRDGAIYLEWTASPTTADLDGYVISLRPEGAGTFDAGRFVGQSTFTNLNALADDTPLINGRQYMIEVTARDLTGNISEAATGACVPVRIDKGVALAPIEYLAGNVISKASWMTLLKGAEFAYYSFLDNADHDIYLQGMTVKSGVTVAAPTIRIDATDAEMNNACRDVSVKIVGGADPQERWAYHRTNLVPSENAYYFDVGVSLHPLWSDLPIQGLVAESDDGLLHITDIANDAEYATINDATMPFNGAALEAVNFSNGRLTLIDSAGTTAWILDFTTNDVTEIAAGMAASTGVFVSEVIEKE